jgi:hypothetical protein
VHLGSAQIFNNRSSFAVGRVTAFLGMNGFEHVAHLADPGGRHMAEDVLTKCTFYWASDFASVLHL